jgi:hypothetical protein
VLLVIQITEVGFSSVSYLFYYFVRLHQQDSLFIDTAASAFAGHYDTFKETLVNIY